ncbi:hypothetical protein [Kaarinaea lacus]
MNNQESKKSVVEKYSVAITTIAKFSGLTVSEVAAGFDNRK